MLPGGSLINPATLTAVLLIFTSICVVFECDITIGFAASLDAKCAAILATTCSTGFATVVVACSDGGTAACEAYVSSMLVCPYEFNVVWLVLALWPVLSCIFRSRMVVLILVSWNSCRVVAVWCYCTCM